MEKFTAIFKYPCNFNSNSPQAKAWAEATPETSPELFGQSLVVITDCGKVFRKQPKHNTGVINTRTEGGKWREISHLLSGNRKAQFLTTLTPANFRGGPKIN